MQVYQREGIYCKPKPGIGVGREHNEEGSLMSDDFQSPPPAPPVVGSDAPSDTGKILAAIGYLVGIVALIAILIEPYKNEKFVRHHAIQALAIWVGWIIISVVSAIPVIGWIVAAVGWIALLVFSIMGLIKAFQGEYWEMPVVYNLVKQYI
ncbi:DUF4870 domain-containing protein [bacterium]|nr:DUF4870 domain-containing protein [bacterium]